MLTDASLVVGIAPIGIDAGRRWTGCCDSRCGRTAALLEK